jgi:hypothetical protein
VIIDEPHPLSLASAAGFLPSSMKALLMTRHSTVMSPLVFARREMARICAGLVCAAAEFIHLPWVVPLGGHMISAA